MTRVLAAHVALKDEKGRPVVLRPGDVVPAWAEGKITNPNVFAADTVDEAPAEPVTPVVEGGEHGSGQGNPDEDKAGGDEPPADPEDETPAGDDEKHDEDEGEADEAESVDYEELTVAKLRELAKSRDLAIRGGKAELVARLEADDRDKASSK